MVQPPTLLLEWNIIQSSMLDVCFGNHCCTLRFCLEMQCSSLGLRLEAQKTQCAGRGFRMESPSVSLGSYFETCFPTLVLCLECRYFSLGVCFGSQCASLGFCAGI